MYVGMDGMMVASRRLDRCIHSSCASCSSLWVSGMGGVILRKELDGYDSRALSVYSACICVLNEVFLEWGAWNQAPIGNCRLGYYWVDFIQVRV